MWRQISLLPARAVGAPKRRLRGSIRWRLGTAVAALVEAGLGNSPPHKIYLGEAGVVAILLAYLLLLLLRAPVARLAGRRKGRP